MELSFLEKYGWPEVASRVILGKFPKIKKYAKKLRAKSSHGTQEQSTQVDSSVRQEYYNRITNIIKKDDIVLIHSSMDGLESIGITAEDFIAFLKEQIAEKSATIVLPCFPITNLKPPTAKSRPYNPKKTLCWTGMLPNTFIGDKDTIRSAFPYNSLAAMGPKAEEMMAKSLEAKYVYDKGSAWDYCLQHHARILFVGVKASGSNTMGIHMVPDVMGEKWPVNNWYEERTYKITIDGEIIEKPIMVQADSWYQYCMEERTSGRLKQAGVLVEESIGGCNLGVVEDCHAMVDVLVELCKKGKLMYMIPGKYRRKQK